MFGKRLTIKTDAEGDALTQRDFNNNMNSLRTSLEAVWYTAVAIALQQKHLLLNTYELLSDIWFVLINDNIASNVRFEVMRHGTFFNLATSRYSYS